MKRLLVFVFFVFATSLNSQSASVYPTRLDDPQAVYLTPGQFPVDPQGQADSSAAIQAAIDKVEETTGEGILFIPEGRYRITRTIYVWSGIRLIGYGANRPVFVLAPNTPGYQKGLAYMFFYAGNRPHPTAGRRFPFRLPPAPPGGVPYDPSISDANPGTFYSAMSNIDFEIGDGNPAAVCIRFHVAQHGYLAHMDFHIGSALAALNDIGNEAEDLHFHGGRYGILTKKPSPAWQFTLIDSTFDGQREASIRENEANLTLVHDEFRDTPTAVAIDPAYSDELWIKNSRFENISGPAVVISNEQSRMTEVNFEDILCRQVPVFAKFRESGHELHAPSSTYHVKAFSHGLTLSSFGAVGAIQTRFTAVPLETLPPPTPNAIRALPPESTWVNLRSLGIRGDGVTDETAAIQQAINAHPVLYIPSGHYIVTNTIHLRPESVLIGLHPDQTQFDIPESTPAFQGPGGPVPLLEAPRWGTNIVTGIGVYTNGINSRAAGVLWMAGETSLVDDVRFLGGHGTRGLDGKRVNPYAPNLFSDPDPRRRWDSQFPSLWITHGGGGTFANIWTPDTFAASGLYVSDTSTPGHVYELSAEHHVRVEIALDNVANWEFYAPQTEGEREESASAISLSISRSHDITIANYHGYRVVRSYHPVPYAVRIYNSHAIHFRNVHVDSNSAMAICSDAGCRQHVRSSKVSFEDCIYDASLHRAVRDREFAWLDVTGRPTVPPRNTLTVEKLASGFYNISGAAVDLSGRLYFVDSHFQRIYRYDPEAKDLRILRDDPLDPVNLVFDKSGDLLVVSSGGKGLSVYSFRPDAPEDQITVLSPEPSSDRPSMTPVLPVDYWVNGDFSDTLDHATLRYVTLPELFAKNVTTRKQFQYVSPDHTLFLPTDPAFVTGPYKFADILQCYGLAKGMPGKPFYVTNEAEERTYSATVNPDGTLANLKLFVEQGGESLVQDRDGNVYLAAGDIFVYNPAGKLSETIRVPARPLDLIFGGKDGRTLFILTQAALYAVRTSVPGAE